MQEAALARDLYFQFADGTLKSEGMKSQFQDEANSLPLHNPVLEAARRLHTGLRMLWSSEGEDLIMLMWKGMRWCCTSKYSDVPVVVATLFDLVTAYTVEADEVKGD